VAGLTIDYLHQNKEGLGMRLSIMLTLVAIAVGLEMPCRVVADEIQELGVAKPASSWQPSVTDEEATSDETVLTAANDELVNNDIINDSNEATSLQADCVASANCNPCNGCNSCQSRCQSRCGCCSCCCKKPRLFGVIAPTDRAFSNFISPMTNPVYFEDPRTLTEARVIFLNHQLPNAVAGGGDVQLLATQIRAALTERLSIIATKDGYVFSRGDGPRVNGWANVNAGLKYNFYRDVAKQRLLTGALIYEMPVGSPHALQGNGTGVFDLTLTGGAQIGQLSHIVSAGGFRLAEDTRQQTDSFWWSTHLDRRLPNAPLYGFFECNLYHYMTNGVAGIPGVGGLDLYNLGSPGIAGTTIVTGALGTKYRFGKSQINEVGIAWEVPLTAKQDIINNRFQADVILRY
jgi:hypothetical protein